MSAPANKLKQRIVGALVLTALAVIFIPMLLKQDEPVQEVSVQAPPMPEIAEAPQLPVAEVAVPEPQEVDEVWDEILIPEQSSPVSSEPAAPPAAPIVADESVAPPQAPKQPAPIAPPAPKPEAQPEQQVIQPGIDKNNLPVSWSIQLANLTNKANAEALRNTYRKKQYNAYLRSSGDTHRVLIGPLIKRSEAQTLCKNLKDREGQDCFVVRYEPDTGQ